jgi:hypothetical protein
MTKREQIEQHLIRFGVIDVLTAARKYNAYRLADDIMQLEKQGRVLCKHKMVRRNYMQYIRISPNGKR